MWNQFLADQSLLDWAAMAFAALISLAFGFLAFWFLLGKSDEPDERGFGEWKSRAVMALMCGFVCIVAASPIFFHVKVELTKDFAKVRSQQLLAILDEAQRHACSAEVQEAAAAYRADGRMRRAVFEDFRDDVAACGRQYRQREALARLLNQSPPERAEVSLHDLRTLVLPAPLESGS